MSAQSPVRVSTGPCPIHGCQKTIPRSYLMCLPHWRRVPQELKRAVWATYRRGQEEPGNKVKPSQQYLRVAAAAIAAVNAKERREGTSPGEQLDLLTTSKKRTHVLTTHVDCDQFGMATDEEIRRVARALTEGKIDPHTRDVLATLGIGISDE